MCPNIVSSFSLIIFLCLKLFPTSSSSCQIINCHDVSRDLPCDLHYNRIYRRLCAAALVQIPPEIAKVLKGIDNWSYDVFSLGVTSNGQVLKYLGYDLLNRYGFIHKFKVRRICSFLFRVLAVLFLLSFSCCPFLAVLFFFMFLLSFHGIE